VQNEHLMLNLPKSNSLIVSGWHTKTKKGRIAATFKAWCGADCTTARFRFLTLFCFCESPFKWGILGVGRDKPG
jgi:hypothetical protein